MKTLRLLNIAAVLLLFTPFFQMCSDDEADDIAVAQIADPTADTASSRSTQLIPRDSGATEIPEEEKSTMEEFWELITVPGDNFTTTAFGLFVITAVDVSEGHLSDIWIGSFFTIGSLILTTSSLILLMKRRLKNVVILLWINIALILAAFVAAVVTFDSISQVKWGYYLYLATVGLLLVQARQSVPSLEVNNPGIPAVK